MRSAGAFFGNQEGAGKVLNGGPYRCSRHHTIMRFILRCMPLVRC